jgi:hypothetical protein
MPISLFLADLHMHLSFVSGPADAWYFHLHGQQLGVVGSATFVSFQFAARDHEKSG